MLVWLRALLDRQSVNDFVCALLVLLFVRSRSVCPLHCLFIPLFSEFVSPLGVHVFSFCDWWLTFYEGLSASAYNVACHASASPVSGDESMHPPKPKFEILMPLKPF